MNDHLLNDQDYEAYVLSIGEYDERVFLGEDAPDEIGTPAKVLHGHNCHFAMVSVSDPDPWIQSGQWIRIRILNPDPVSGGQKLLTKVEKNVEISCFEVLDVLF
jgi:hypothetical protein